MPHFFFNYTSEGTTSVDDVGAEFSSLEAAYLDTCKGVLAIAFEKLRARQDPATDSFDIIDAEKNLLMHVPFSEVLRPAGVTSSLTVRQKNILAFQNCQRQVARSDSLKDEIRAEFARTRTIFGAIRASLSAFRPG